MPTPPQPRTGPSEPRLDRLAHLPDPVRQEIDLFLAEDEQLIDALFSASGPVGKLGELWLVVSDRSIFFYTREHGQNPIVSLISRSDVRHVTYSMTPTGVTLTFQPVNHPLNTVRVPFPKAQIKDVNQLCEDLAKTIPFVMDQPESPRALPSAPETPPPVSSTTLKAPGSTGQSPQPSPTSAAPLPKSASGDDSPTQPAAPSPSAPLPPTPPTHAAPPSAETSRFPFPEFKEPQGLRFIALATLISLCVGYLWYRLFQAIADRR